MSVTISQLLKLPSLQGVQLCAGEQGLSNIVSSISVLEYAQPSYLQDALFHNHEFQGGEIVISGLISIQDDVKAQCECIRRLHEVGEVGLILYYVGIFVKELDQSVLDTANQLGFPLLCMPIGRMDLRYSEVIQEVMELIMKDRSADTYIVSELLERISKLPKQQRSMDSVLRMVADRTHASFYLCDESYDCLNEATWPRKANLEFADIRSDAHSQHQEAFTMQKQERLFYMRKQRIQGEHPMLLFAAKENAEIELDMMKQIQEIIILFINIWSQSHGAKRSDELIRSILQDEPVKMRRLAEIMHVDVESIHSMWCLQLVEKEDMQLLVQVQKQCEDFLHLHYHQVISAIVKDALIVFMGKERLNGNELSLSSDFIDRMTIGKQAICICGSHALKDTGRVRSAYMDIQDFLDYARILYPNRQSFSMTQLAFAKEIKKHVEEGEAHVAEMLQLFQFETRDELQKEELLHTLSVYLLDADMQVQKAADLLFVHKNTIKYRIQILEEKLHTPLHKLSEVWDLYKAIAIYRLIQPRT